MTKQELFDKLIKTEAFNDEQATQAWVNSAFESDYDFEVSCSSLIRVKVDKSLNDGTGWVSIYLDNEEIDSFGIYL